jgi:hypothetical protein
MIKELIKYCKRSAHHKPDLTKAGGLQSQGVKGEIVAGYLVP